LATERACCRATNSSFSTEYCYHLLLGGIFSFLMVFSLESCEFEAERVSILSSKFVCLSTAKIGPSSQPQPLEGLGGALLAGITQLPRSHLFTFTARQVAPHLSNAILHLQFCYRDGPWRTLAQNTSPAPPNLNCLTSSSRTSRNSQLAPCAIRCRGPKSPARPFCQVWWSRILRTG